ncbi:MAG TPA: hypothetical protein VMV71_03105 [Candidatus Paceibacterota bacterium]|nr:hypothetical protein [Candidatus Paceibacterota bacterium]
MNDEIRKCEKCGQKLKQSGPDAHNKPEGEPAHKGTDEINFWCMNENCEKFNKNIKVVE